MSFIDPPGQGHAAASPSAEGVPSEEGIDPHEAAEAARRDPEEQLNHTDPAKEPDETDTAPGRRGTEAHRRDD